MTSRLLDRDIIDVEMDETLFVVPPYVLLELVIKDNNGKNR